MTEKYIVQMNDECWLAPWSGDPGRTMCRSSAKEFSSLSVARRAITKAKKFRPNSNFKIVAATTPPAAEPGAERSE